MLFGIHICPVEIAMFFSSIWGVKWLWHCCQDKLKSLKCGHDKPQA